MVLKIELCLLVDSVDYKTVVICGSDRIKPCIPLGVTDEAKIV